MEADSEPQSVPACALKISISPNGKSPSGTVRAPKTGSPSSPRPYATPFKNKCSAQNTSIRVISDSALAPSTFLTHLNESTRQQTENGYGSSSSPPLDCQRTQGRGSRVAITSAPAHSRRLCARHRNSRESRSMSPAIHSATASPHIC